MFTSIIIILLLYFYQTTGCFPPSKSMAECNTVLSAYTKLSHLGQCCTQLSNCEYNDGIRMNLVELTTNNCTEVWDPPKPPPTPISNLALEITTNEHLF